MKVYLSSKKKKNHIFSNGLVQKVFINFSIKVKFGFSFWIFQIQFEE